MYWNCNNLQKQSEGCSGIFTAMLRYSYFAKVSAIPYRNTKVTSYAASSYRQNWNRILNLSVGVPALVCPL